MREDIDFDINEILKKRDRLLLIHLLLLAPYLPIWSTVLIPIIPDGYAYSNTNKNKMQNHR